VITGGFNVYPREIEDVLSAHPAVSNCAIIGVPDPHWGEAVKAIVVLRRDCRSTADELRAYVREIKGPLHTPKTVDFVSVIPLTPVGKPDKKLLRMQFASSREGSTTHD
jgi:fatty-acyl-CoA synthase